MSYHYVRPPAESGGIKGPGYIMEGGQTNQIPANQWPFKGIAPPYRVRRVPMPCCDGGFLCLGSATCDGAECQCDWWREKIHRNLAWTATTARNEYVLAKQALLLVPGTLSVAEYVAQYLKPLKKSSKAINVEASSEFTKNRFNSYYSQKACTGKSFCENGYYPRQYWIDMSLIIDAHIQDLESELADQIEEATDQGYAGMSAPEIIESILKGESPDVIDYGIPPNDIEQELINKGAQGMNFTPKTESVLPYTPGAGMPPGKGTTEDDILKAFLSGSDERKKPLDTQTMLLIGGGLLAALFLLRG